MKSFGVVRVVVFDDDVVVVDFVVIGVCSTLITACTLFSQQSRCVFRTRCWYARHLGSLAITAAAPEQLITDNDAAHICSSMSLDAYFLTANIN